MSRCTRIWVPTEAKTHALWRTKRRARLAKSPLVTCIGTIDLIQTQMTEKKWHKFMCLNMTMDTTTTKCKNSWLSKFTIIKNRELNPASKNNTQATSPKSISKGVSKARTKNTFGSRCTILPNSSRITVRAAKILIKIPISP